MKLLLTSLLLTLSILAANFGGKWTGTFVDSAETSKNEGLVLILTQDGNTLTGTAGPTADEQMAISNGKIDSNNVTFDLKAEEIMIHFTLQLVDNHLKGQATAEVAGEKHSGVIDLTRAT
jgi:hypothetical protein